MKFLFQSYDQYEIPWSKDRRRDGLRDVKVSKTTPTCYLLKYNLLNSSTNFSTRFQADFPYW